MVRVVQGDKYCSQLCGCHHLLTLIHVPGGIVLSTLIAFAAG
jgi:hypothetical protein